MQWLRVIERVALNDLNADLAFRVDPEKIVLSGRTQPATVSLGLPVPLVPSGVNAAPRFDGWAINVTWTDNSTDETGFRVERAATDAGPWTSIGSTGPGATSFDPMSTSTTA